MHYAARQSTPDKLRLLLAHGGDPNLRSRPSVRSEFSIDYWPTPIYYAIMGDAPENARLLIKAGANVNARRDDGETPLMSAASACCFDVMYVLLEAGADFRAKDPYGFTVTYILQRHLFTITPVTDEKQDPPIRVDLVEPHSTIAKSKQRCIEFLEKRGVDFNKERLRNAELEQRILDQNERDAVLALKCPDFGPRKYRAADFFADVKVAQLAEAARGGDVAGIDRLISEGAVCTGCSGCRLPFISNNGKGSWTSPRTSAAFSRTMQRS